MESVKYHGIGFAAVLTAFVLGYCFPVRAQESDFDRLLTPFFDRHCYECHDDAVAKGGLDLNSLGKDLTNPALFAQWERIYDRVFRGEMPPAKKPRPAGKELESFGKSLGLSLADVHQAHKGTVLRRLNRREYENTLNDLFGTQLDLAGLLPEDGRSHEFDNVGEALGISMTQMERYLEGIGQVLQAAIAEFPESQMLKADYASSSEGEKHIPQAWGRAPDGATVFYRPNGYPTGMLRGTGVNRDGYYKVRVTGYAHQSDKPVTFSVGGTSFAPGSAKPTYRYFSFRPGKPQTVEFTQLIRNRYMISIDPWGLKDEGNWIRTQNTTAGYAGAGLAINHVEVEGPLQKEEAGRGFQLIFEGINRVLANPGQRNPVYRIMSSDPVGDAEKVLTRIANKAFRRPVSKEEIAPYAKLFKDQWTSPDVYQDALFSAISALFVAPDFLYLKENSGFLSDFQLASRLSYAFHRTLPDEELLAAAASGKLATDPQVFLAQVDRLLNSDRFERFIVDFTDAWLNLRDIDFTTPDDKLFPEFDGFLRDSFLLETRGYVRELIASNLPAQNIVKSDFAMLNSRLAEHYGLAEVEGPEIRKVKLPQGSPRGGILSQGSILKVSANGTNTSPVVRGVWVMERIVGRPPAPPPPGVPGVEPDIRGAETLRELLDKHRSSESCQGCHAVIDPPGFALESFNPIGGWRDHFRSLGEGEKVKLEIKGRSVNYRMGPPVDASGKFENGAAFANYLEFRDLLAKGEEQLAEAFVAKILTFCCGREMGFSDRPLIQQIVRDSARSGYGIRELIRRSVASEIFRKK